MEKFQCWKRNQCKRIWTAVVVDGTRQQVRLGDLKRIALFIQAREMVGSQMMVVACVCGRCGGGRLHWGPSDSPRAHRVKSTKLKPPHLPGRLVCPTSTELHRIMKEHQPHLTGLYIWLRHVIRRPQLSSFPAANDATAVRLLVVFIPRHWREESM